MTEEELTKYMKRLENVEIQLHTLSKDALLIANSINAFKYPLLRKLTKLSESSRKVKITEGEEVE